MKKQILLAAFGTVVALGVACSTTPMSPTSPSAADAGSLAANADGSTLKVSAPSVVSPFDSERVDSRRPIFVWLNATGKNETIGMEYEIEVVDGANNRVYNAIAGETPGNGSHTVPFDLNYDTLYAWRIRAANGNERGPWSVWGNFRTVTRPAPTTPTISDGGGNGTVGPPRSIDFGEAYAIVKRIHDQGRFNLGASSSRDYRVNFIFGAVAAVHYGHPRWNPAGPDARWCVKDAGAGRPPSDDVIARCDTREAWDLIISAGGNGYSWHADYLGRLPTSQNIYAPGRASLLFIPQ